MDLRLTVWLSGMDEISYSEQFEEKENNHNKTGNVGLTYDTYLMVMDGFWTWFENKRESTIINLISKICACPRGTW